MTGSGNPALISPLTQQGFAEPTSVAEPPLFWAAPAPAPGRQGPGADSGSDLLGSAPAPGKKKEAPGGSGSIH